MCSAVYVAEDLGAIVLEHEVHGQSALLALADRRRGDLVAAEQRAGRASGRGPGLPAPGSGRAARSRAGRSGRRGCGPNPGRSTPGSSTTTRSEPWVTTTGSETPVSFTRRSTMSLMIDMSAGPGDLPSTGCAWYSTRRPPDRSRPELGLDVPRATSGCWRPGSVMPGKKSMKRATTPMRTMRNGPALRIAAGCYTERPPDAADLRPPGSP